MVETNIGERLIALHTDGRIGGKAVLSFLAALSLYCAEAQVNEDMLQWFSRLETVAKGSIRGITRSLIQSFYGGYWDYGEDEYEWFLHRTRDTTVTEDAFKETIRQVQEKWVDVEDILGGTNRLVQLLTEAEPESTWWYAPGITEADLRALAQTLELAAARKAQRVRLRFI